MQSCFRTTALLLVLACGITAQATEIQLSGELVHDAQLNSVTSYDNYGGSTVLRVGYDASGAEIGRILVGFDLTQLPALAEIESAILIGYCDSIGANVSEIIAANAGSRWVEGTDIGAANSSDGCTWSMRGKGVAINGESILPGLDSLWLLNVGDYVTSLSPQANVIDIPSASYAWDVTAAVSDSVAFGATAISFALMDTNYDGAGQAEWADFRSAEHANGATSFRLILDVLLPGEDTIDTMLVNLTNAAGKPASYTSFIWFYLDAIGSSSYSVWGTDGTPLYCCVDSLSQNYVRLAVRSGSRSQVYIIANRNLPYENCDSTYLYWESYDEDFAYSYQIDSTEQLARASHDTSNGAKPIIDISTYGFTWSREIGNVAYDSTRGARAYLTVLSVGYTFPNHYIDDSVDSVFVAVFSSPDMLHWNYDGIAVFDNDPNSGADTLCAEDPWLMQQGDSLFMLHEHKLRGAPNRRDHVGLAVSSDWGLTWEWRGVLLDTLFSGTVGVSPSSPVGWFDGDSVYVAFEEKNGFYHLNGLTYYTNAGVISMAKGANLYNLQRLAYPNALPQDGYVPMIPYFPRPHDYYDKAGVPDTYFYAEGYHYLSAHVQDSTDNVWKTAYWRAQNPDSVWVPVPGLSDKPDLWSTSINLSRSLSTDPQVYFDGTHYWATSVHEDTLIAGVYYGFTNDIYLLNMQGIDSVNVPYRGRFARAQRFGALGYAYAQNSVLTLEAESVIERNSVAYWTAQDSFQTDYAVDVRLKLVQGTYNDPLFVFSLGDSSFVNQFGETGTDWSRMMLGDGAGYILTGTPGYRLFRQPYAATWSPQTEVNTLIPNVHEWMVNSVSVENDSLWFGFWNNTRTPMRHDTLDSQENCISISAGATEFSPDKGARILIDWLRVRKWQRPEIVAIPTDTLRVQGNGATDPQPEAPTLVIRQVNTDIVLDMQASPCCGKFYIYRAPSDSGPWTLLGSTFSPTWIDHNRVETSSQDFYYVRRVIE